MLPKLHKTLYVWVASSLVGDNNNTCVVLLFTFIKERDEIINVAVLPVPDCAWAITSFPHIIGLIALH